MLLPSKPKHLTQAQLLFAKLPHPLFVCDLIITQYKDFVNLCYNGLMDKRTRSILFKTAIFILSLSLGWFLVKSDYLHNLISTVLPYKFLAQFIAGMLYTSFLTSPVSVAMFLVIAGEGNPVTIVLLGGIGAAFGDLLIIRLFRDNYKNEVNGVSRQLQFQRIDNFLKKYHLEYLIPLLGAIIIASPFPDEIGLLMLGISKLEYRQIALVSFILNSAGILLIVAPINLLLKIILS